MLGYILIYYIGKTFFLLAKRHQKHKWGYAFFGILSYFIASFIAGIIIVVVLEIMDPGAIDRYSDNELGLIAMPFGIFGCWLTYQFLKKNWETKAITKNDDILDYDFEDDDF